MVVYCVTVYVKNEYIDDFISATVKNRFGTVQESGNVRFDVLRCTTNPVRFFLYEVYKSEDAVAEHKETSHYKEWKETVANWMAQPREGIQFDVIAPRERNEW